MPKVSSGKKYLKGYSEEDLQKALKAVRDGMSKKKAAKTCNIPRATLQFRSSSKFIKTRPGPATVLTTIEEDELEKWITLSSRKGFPRRKEDVIQSVKHFLEKNPRPNNFIDNTPGEGWFNLFLKRHLGISVRTSEAVTSASSKVSEKQIRNWFRQIEIYLKENNLFDILSNPTRVYNGDETCFILCPKNTKVLAPKGERNVYEIEHAQSKSCITVMFTFAADGETTPPMIIFPLKRMRTEIFNSVPKEWGIGLSDNGWMKADIFYEYIQNVLHPALQKKNVTFPVILFLDGHKSHTTLQVSQLCQNLGIILIALYPNATRILQPADVAAFRPIKVLWRKAVLEWRSQNLSKTLLKTDVGPILQILLTKINKITLINGFKTCGLCPFNPNQVDYTKCLTQPKLDQELVKNTISANLNYQIFQEMVGPQLMRKMRNQAVRNTKEAKILFNIYKLLNPKTSPTPVSPSSMVERPFSTTSLEITQSKTVDSEVSCQISYTVDEPYLSSINTPITNSAVQELIQQEEENPINQEGNTTSSAEIIKNVVVSSETLEHENEDTNFNAKIDFQISNTVNKSQLSFVDVLTQDSVMPNSMQNLEIMYDHQEQIEPASVLIIPEPTSFLEIPTTSLQDLLFVDEKWVPVDNISLEIVADKSVTPKKKALNDFLYLPKTPAKKQNKTIQHRSFVLTSKEWEASELEKQQKKVGDLQQKEAKKKQRLEKAEIKRIEKEKKQVENINKKKKTTKPSTITKNTAKENNPNISKKPKIVILSDITFAPSYSSSDPIGKREYNVAQNKYEQKDQTQNIKLQNKSLNGESLKVKKYEQLEKYTKANRKPQTIENIQKLDKAEPQQKHDKDYKMEPTIRESKREVKHLKLLSEKELVSILEEDD